MLIVYDACVVVELTVTNALTLLKGSGFDTGRSRELGIHNCYHNYMYILILLQA